MKIVQGLAHAHKHNIGKGALRGLARLLEIQHLTDNFSRSQTAHEAPLGGQTKATTDGAPHLRGDADRALVTGRDEHGLDLVPILQAKQKFFGAIGTLLLP